jgi:hypothetical protein
MVVSGLQTCVTLSKTFLHRRSFIYYVTQSPIFSSKWLFLMMAEKLGFLEMRRLLVHSIRDLAARGMKVRSNMCLSSPFIFLRILVICAISGSQFL